LEKLLRMDRKGVIVTGGAVGIGRGIVYRFAEAGAHVCIVDIDHEIGVSVAAEISKKYPEQKIFFSRCDMSNEEEIISTVKAAKERFGELNVLVNNAGIYPMNPAMTMTTQQYQKVQDVNVRGPWIMTREFVKEVDGAGDKSVINIGSIDSYHPSNIGLAAYDTSKGALLMQTRSLALECAQKGVRVNLIAPGAILTEGVKNLTGKGEMDEFVKYFVNKTPMKRMGDPDEIACAVLFFASEGASFMTGSSLVIDGGTLLV